MSGGGRNHVIDVARACSVLVVVVFHTLLYRIELTDAGPTLVPWAAPTWLYPLTWVLMIMPLFFVAGGFAHTLTIDRMRREGDSPAQYLASRGRRFVGPLVVFVSFCAVLFSLAAWAGPLDAASELSRLLMQLLWFVTVYLGIVVVAPRAVRLHDRFGVWPMLVLAVLAAAVDAWSFATGRWELRNLNMALVWPLVHQFGIAYQRGWWRRGPVWTAWASVVAGAALVGLLVFGFGYPPTSVGFADLPIANIQPPTLAMAALALAQCGVLALVERSGLLRSVPERAAESLGVLNAVMVSVYLWHIPCIALAGGVLTLVAIMVPAAAPLLLSPAVLAPASLVAVGLIVPALGRLELRLIPPMGPRQDLTLAVLAFGVLGFGTLLVWQTGTVVHWDRPGSTLGVVMVLVGAWLMVRAADASQAAVRR
ncbi:acyltransferase family protein [Propioniciclava sinopodophylli]|nr:acyltransferase family protein [Propioniciclava sinopodophylli]